MNTQVIKIDKNNIDHDEMKKLGKIIANGGLVAFPTETVYGLGANAFDDQACKNIYIAKGRPSDNPLIVHFADIESVEETVWSISEDAKKLFHCFSPGPLTVILKKTDKISNTVTAGLDTVAVRIPSDIVARELIKASGVPIAAPSANLSGKPSPTTSRHVIADMNGRIDAIIDAHDCSVGVESTIVDMSGKFPVILRPGGITFSQIKKILPNAVIDEHILSGSSKDEKPKCPGMKYRHYAPDADVTVVEGEMHNVRKKINELLSENSNKKCGILTLGQASYKAGLVINAGNNNKEYAKNLFKSLREFDENNIDIVFAEFIIEDDYSLTVKNRLYKSAGNKVIYV